MAKKPMKCKTLFRQLVLLFLFFKVGLQRTYLCNHKNNATVALPRPRERTELLSFFASMTSHHTGYLQWAIQRLTNWRKAGKRCLFCSIHDFIFLAAWLFNMYCLSVITIVLSEAWMMRDLEKYLIKMCTIIKQNLQENVNIHGPLL